jgi:hypothetical protein
MINIIIVAVCGGQAIIAHKRHGAWATAAEARAKQKEL